MIDEKPEWYKTLIEGSSYFYWIEKGAKKKHRFDDLKALTVVHLITINPKLTHLSDPQIQHEWGFIMTRSELTHIKNAADEYQKDVGGLEETRKSLSHLCEIMSEDTKRILFVHNGVTLYRDGEVKYKQCYCDVCTEPGFENTFGNNEAAIIRLLEDSK